MKILSIIISAIIAFLSWLIPLSPTRAKFEVKNMTLEQKIGQMIMPAFRTWTDGTDSYDVTELNDSLREAIKKYGFGGVALFAENTKGTEQTVKLIDDLQSCAVNGLAQLPMLISIDQEGGYIIRLQTGTCTPGNMALGAINSESETRKSAEIISSELSALGINTNFAPDLDINCNPANPVIGVRSFSSDSRIVSQMGTAYIEGMHDNNIIATGKHFPGHGDTGTDSHTGLPLIDKTYEELKQNELIPFKTAIDAGIDMIMSAHIVFPQIETEKYVSISTGEEINLPATLSKKIITEILRNDLGFKGVVTTDALNMGAISDNIRPEDAAILAINAGIDILLMPVNVTCRNDIDNFDSYIQNIVNAVKSGKIEEKTIDEAVNRIIALKIKRGVIKGDNLTAEERTANAKKIVGSAEHHKSELETAEKAVTVFKNDGTLPLKVSDKVLFMYPYEDEGISIQFMIDRLKAESTLPADYSAPAYCFKNKSVENFGSEISNTDIIVIISAVYSANYLRPTSKTGWQAAFNDALIEKAHSMGKKVVVASIQLPYDVARYQEADTVIASYCEKDMTVAPTVFDGETKTYGVGIAAATATLYDTSTAQGKSPVDIPKIDENYNFTDETLYPLGYSLG